MAGMFRDANRIDNDCLFGEVNQYWREVVSLRNDDYIRELAKVGFRVVREHHSQFIRMSSQFIC